MGIKKGENIGVQKEKLEIAKAMLKERETIEKIIRLTVLSASDLEEAH